jgi:hypothetical protein
MPHVLKVLYCHNHFNFVLASLKLLKKILQKKHANFQSKHKVFHAIFTYVQDIMFEV